jgi:CRISPR-associated protein Csx10
MTRFSVVVEPHMSLFVGGYSFASRRSDGDTAMGADGRPLLPGSAVKGALREAAARLVNAAEHGHDVLTRLFGGEGIEGLIRVGPLEAVVHSNQDGADGELSVGSLPDLSPRHHVSLIRASRQAAPQRLFQNLVTPAVRGLCFRGELCTTRRLDDDEDGLLRAAVQITDQIGAGRGRGLGLVSMRLEEDSEREAAAGPLDTQGQDHVVLVLRAFEPLQLGAVKDVTNLSSTSGFIQGSTLRGAVARALVTLGQDEHLESVMGGPSPARFGDARPGHGLAIPAPLTLREPKRGGPPTDDAASQCVAALSGVSAGRDRDTRPVAGTVGPYESGWALVSLKWRVVTRTARDHRSGKAAHGRLYSLEVVEPVLGESGPSGGDALRFYAPVSGHPDQIARIVDACSAGLLVGRARSRGFGKVELASVEVPESIGSVRQRHQGWTDLLTRLGATGVEATGVLLALGPIAVNQRLLRHRLAEAGLQLIGGVSRRRPGGGWNSAEGLPRTVSSQLVPGSTFIVKTVDGRSAVDALEHVERSGIGPGRADGWGRLVACHPVHVACCKEV